MPCLMSAGAGRSAGAQGRSRPTSATDPTSNHQLCRREPGRLCSPCERVPACGAGGMVWGGIKAGELPLTPAAPRDLPRLSRRRTHLGILALTLTLFCLCLVDRAGATPKLSSCLLRWGRSPRLIAESWATFSFHIQNPDPEPVTVRIALHAEQRAVAIFEKELSVGANAYVRDTEMVTGSPSETYTASLYVGAQRVGWSTIYTKYRTASGRWRLLVIDDSPDSTGVSTVTRNDKLVTRAEAGTASVKNMPLSWIGYDNVRAVALADPDFTVMLAGQYQALIDYVHRGGTVVFLSPSGTLAAADTPLRELLPVRPLRIRRVEELPALDQWGAVMHESAYGPGRQAGVRVPLQSADGIPFLESSPLGDGITTLREGSFPICRWRRCGLGRVGVLAVDPRPPLMEDSGCFLALWDHVLSWTQPPYCLSYAANGRLLPEIAALLTGYVIPDAALIQRVLLLYLGVLLVVFAAGTVLRRHAVAWIGAGLLGLGLTAGVFAAASRRNAHRVERSATVLDFSTTDSRHSSAHAVISLFSKSDCRPTFVDREQENAIRALPPPLLGGSHRYTLGPSLLLRRVQGHASVPRLAVQALRPRLVGTSYSSTPMPLPRVPCLRNGPEGTSLDTFPLPDWLTSSRTEAYIGLQNGCLPVRAGDGRLTGIEPRLALLQLNPVATKFCALISSGLFPTPALVLMQPWDADRHSLSLALPGFDQRGYAVRFLPLSHEVEPGLVTVTSAQIRVWRSDIASDIVERRGHELSNLFRARSDPFPFHVILPPLFGRLLVRDVTVELDAANPGGNVSFDIGLRPGIDRTGTVKLRPWTQALRASERADMTFRFREVGSEAFLDPLTARFTLLLRATEKKAVTSALAAERANNWRLLALRVTVVGEIPADGTVRF